MPIETLIKGFRKFRSSYFEDSRHYQDLVKNGQSPETLVIACSDSRNDPALMTGSKPGDIFSIRNVAAIVPPYQPDKNYHGTSAAIEFAVKGLKVKNIIVLGHALCGGVQALAEGEQAASYDYEFLTPWIEIGEPARASVERILPDAPKTVKQTALEQAIILTSLNNLMTFPWIRTAVEAGQINLRGWYFDMVKGRLLDYDFAAGAFCDITNKGDDLQNLLQSGSALQHGCGCHCAHTWSLEPLLKKYA